MSNPDIAKQLPPRGSGRAMTRPPPGKPSRAAVVAGWDRQRREHLEAEKRALEASTPGPAEAMQRALQLSRRVVELARAEAEEQAWVKAIYPARWARGKAQREARLKAPPRMVTQDQAWNEVDREWEQAVRDGRVRAEAEFAPMPMPNQIAELTEAVLSSKAGARLGPFWRKIAPHMDAKVISDGRFPHLGAACKFARSMGDMDRKAVAKGIEAHFPHWYVGKTLP